MSAIICPACESKNAETRTHCHFCQTSLIPPKPATLTGVILFLLGWLFVGFGLLDFTLGLVLSGIIPRMESLLMILVGQCFFLIRK